MADVKISELPLNAAPTADDLLAMVDGGTVTKKCTIGAALAVSMGWYDSSSWASINAAVAAIGATQVTLVISTAETLTANLTIPATLNLAILKSGSIAKASTYTLTINGPFEAGLYQVFSGFDAADVTFGAGAVKEAYPEWWGPNTTPGTTDMTVEIQSALDSGAPDIFFNGIYLVSNTSTVHWGLGAGADHYYSLMIKSDTILRFAMGSTIKLANAGNSHIFVNDGIEGAGNSNIAILGPAIIDGNQANQTDPATGEQSGGLFHDVTNLHIDRIKFTNMREYALRITNITKGTFTHLWCTDSDGSGFAFGLDSNSDFDMNECFFDDIKSENCAGGFAGAIGNGFIFHGHYCQIGTLYANANAFGDKIQDTSSYIEIDKAIAKDISGDAGFKILGTDAANRASHITVNSIQTSGCYAPGTYIEKVSDISIGQIISEGDATSNLYPGVWIGEGQRQSYSSIICTNAINAGVVIRADAKDITIGKIIAYNSGQTTDSPNVSILGEYINIGEIISIDDQGTPTVTRGVDLSDQCLYIQIGKVMAKGDFTSDGFYTAGEDVYATIGTIVVIGDMPRAFTASDAVTHEVTVSTLVANGTFSDTAISIAGTEVWIAQTLINDVHGSYGITPSNDLYPNVNNTYYLGKNDDDTPFAWKGVILKDTTDGKYYRIEVVSGVVTATDLTD
jgi:hypothetical protein